MNAIIQSEDLGKIFRHLRNKCGLTQAALATQMQLHGSIMSRETYAQIEHGGRNIKISDLKIIKRIFNVTYEELLGDTTEH
jgi:Predicted transcriptional regulators